MQSATLQNVLTFVEPTAWIVLLSFMMLRQQVRTFGFLFGFLSVRAISSLLLAYVIHLSRIYALSTVRAYNIYFSLYWTSYAIEAILGFGIIYSLYKLALEPLPGLQRLGTIMFRWAGGIALALAVSVGCGPHITGTSFVMRFVTELQQTQSVITLSMLFFVILASKPMGLSHRSKIVGVSLGLGVLAATDMVLSSWIQHKTAMRSTCDLINALSILTASGIWMTYFAMPEPARRMIVLPTTSPFLRWNQISQVLGDEPGFVAIGRVTPEMFAPAEVEIMLRASVKMSSQRSTARS